VIREGRGVTKGFGSGMNEKEIACYWGAAAWVKGERMRVSERVWCRGKEGGSARGKKKSDADGNKITARGKNRHSKKGPESGEQLKEKDQKKKKSKPVKYSASLVGLTRK